jgi:hypothetical protein
MPQVIDQACGCVGRSIGESFDPIPFVCGPVSEVATVADMVLCFDDRCLGDTEEVREFWMMVPSESLCDVSWTGTGRIENLIAEFEIAASR